MIALEWKTVKVKPNDLIELEYNPRKITEEKRKKLIESLNKFNLVEIPAINLDNRIIGGNQRVRALIIAGRGDLEIDVRVPNRELTEPEIKEYNLISNSHSGEFDLDILLAEFSDISLGDIGIDLKKLQFEQSDIFSKGLIKFENLQSRMEDPKPFEDDFEDPDIDKIQTNIKLGDIITIGQHRLICGDSKSFEDIQRLMDGKKASMVFTDPPYNVKINSIVNLGKVQHEEFCEGSGELTKEEFIDFLTKAFKNLIEFSIDGSIHYICMDWKHIYELMTAGNCYTEFKNLCVWNKDNGGMGSFYRSKHELIFVFKNGKAKHINNFELGQFGRYRTNVWDYAGVNSFSTRERIDNKSVGHSDIEYHPTVKPVKLIADAILDCSNPGNIILDTFVGSGTTIIASDQMKRICYCSEKDPKYCQVIINRVLKYKPEIEIKINGIKHDEY